MTDKSVARASGQGQRPTVRRVLVVFLLSLVATVAWWYLALVILFEPIGFIGLLFTLCVSLPVTIHGELSSSEGTGWLVKWA